MRKLSIIGFILSLGWIIASSVRWFWLYPDTSQLILSLIMGIAGLYVSYDLNWKSVKTKEDKKQTARIDAIVDWWTKREADAVHNVARYGED